MVHHLVEIAGASEKRSEAPVVRATHKPVKLVSAKVRVNQASRNLSTAQNWSAMGHPGPRARFLLCMSEAPPAAAPPWTGTKNRPG